MTKVFIRNTSPKTLEKDVLETLSLYIYKKKKIFKGSWIEYSGEMRKNET